jgi:glucose/arabinose dehydrogenase
MKPFVRHRSWVPALAACFLALFASRTASADELTSDAATAFEMSTFQSDLELVTATVFLPDGRTVFTEKSGRVVVRTKDGQTVVAATLAVDTVREKGLLNVIAHPAFEQTKQLIFYYSAKERPVLDKHKVSLIRLGDDNKLELATEKVLVRGLRGPDDHEQGGALAIDRKGNLLIGVGDTGCRAKKLPEPPYTPTNYFATCLTNGNGKILRVALDGSIPDDNPLANVDSVSACGERCADDPKTLPAAPPRRDIWAWGLRNPWRMWVDPRTGSVWTADVGDLANEEIDIIPEAGGLHLGWPWREGGQGHPVSVCRDTNPSRGDCVEPAYYCKHDDAPGTAEGGCKSINGGLIVDDCRFPAAFRGKYLFADNANGRIWTVTPTPDRQGIVPGSRRDVGQIDGFIVDLDVGPDAALYASVMRIPPEPSVVLRLAPRELGTCVAEPLPVAAKATPTAGMLGAAARPTKAPTSHLRRLLSVALSLALLVALAAAVLESRKS